MELKHSGFIAVVGRPSVGKSTFLNTLCGFKVSIVSRTPQTTRSRVRAIFNAEQQQLVFVDTPGMHFSEKKYNQELIEVSRSALADSDAVLFLSDLSRPFGKEEIMVLEILQPFAAKTVAALSKSDLAPREAPVREKEIREYLTPVAFLSFSALDRQGCLAVAQQAAALVPPGPMLYPAEYYTDQTQEFRITEIIREKVFIHMRQEIPHSVYVAADSILYREDKERLKVRATIFTESDSQKAMVIGKGGAMIRQISSEARQDIREIFGLETDLMLKADVHKNWRKDQALLKKFFD